MNRQVVMLWMFIAAFLVSGAIQDPHSACQPEQDRMRRAYAAAIENMNDHVALTALVNAARAERVCIGEATVRTGVVLTFELWALARLGRLSEVIALVDELFDDLVHVARPADLSYIQQRAGEVYFMEDRYAEASRAYHDAVRLAPPEDRSQAYVVLSLLQRRTHSLNEALASIDSAKVYLGQAKGIYTEPTIRVQELDYLATWYLQGNPVDTSRALDIVAHQDQIYDYLDAIQMDYTWISVTEQLSTLYLVLGDTLRSEESLRRLNRSYPSDGHRATAYRALGAHAMVRGDVEQALGYFRAAETMLDDITANNRVDVLTSLGDLHYLQDDLDKALHYYMRANDAAFNEAGQGISSDLTAALYQNVRRSSRRASATYALKGETERALEHFDLLGARYLNALRQIRRADSGVRASEIHRELTDLRVQMRRKQGEDLASARARESALVAELDHYADLLVSVPPVDLRSIQAKLRSQNQIMLVYVIDQIRGRRPITVPSTVFVVTPDLLEAVTLDVTHEEIVRLINATSPLFASGTAGIREQAFDLRALHDLYRHLVAPVEAHLTEGARLVVVPDGPLFHVPFGMLVREPVGRFDYRSARYLIHDHAISVELAASLYLNPGGEERGDRIVAMGRSRFQSEDGRSMIDLPATRREVGRLRSLFANAAVFQDEAATPSVMFAGLRDATALHVATHATLDPASHLNHSIFLSPDSSRADGMVYMFDLLSESFGTPFIALTGCATAAGHVRSGDGMAGFQYAFRASNVGSVLSTHWLVDDELMADIAHDFYRGLAEGMHKDEALRRAQLAYLQTASHQQASPFFWAAPVLYGDTTPLQFTPAKPRGRNIGLSAAVLLALVAALLLQRRSALSKSPAPSV